MSETHFDITSKQNPDIFTQIVYELLAPFEFLQNL